MSVVCPAGHLNPPYSTRCRLCQAPVPVQTPEARPRPSLGQLRLSSGGIVPLDRGAILGRNPRVPPNRPGPAPHLIRIADPNRDISTQHLEVKVDDWFVAVTDLGSTNGSKVVVPGRPAAALRPNEPETIEPGTRVILAGAFDFVYEPPQ
jgi:hypothetical protein